MITLNGSNTVTLSKPAGGAVTIGANGNGGIAGTGTGALTIPVGSNVVFNRPDNSAAPTHLTGGTLTLNTFATLGSGATTVNSGAADSQWP